MNFEIVAQIDEALIPLAVALYVIGMFLKATPKIADWSIPWILLLVSLLAANVMIGWSVASTIQGVLACGIAVLGNQLYKQAQLGIYQSKIKSIKKK